MSNKRKINCSNQSKKSMTQSKFIKYFLLNSAISEEELNKRGMFAVPCNCSDEVCQGWVMISKENLQNHINLYLK
jgi:hypothetical protein